MLALEIMSNGEVKDRAQEGFLVASHEEAVEEGADLVIDGIRLGVQTVEPVDHAEDEASKDARRMGAVRGEIHV